MSDQEQPKDGMRNASDLWPQRRSDETQTYASESGPGGERQLPAAGASDLRPPRHEHAPMRRDPLSAATVQDRARSDDLRPGRRAADAAPGLRSDDLRPISRAGQSAVATTEVGGEAAETRSTRNHEGIRERVERIQRATGQEIGERPTPVVGKPQPAPAPYAPPPYSPPRPAAPIYPEAGATSEPTTRPPLGAYPSNSPGPSTPPGPWSGNQPGSLPGSDPRGAQQPEAPWSGPGQQAPPPQWGAGPSGQQPWGNQPPPQHQSWGNQPPPQSQPWGSQPPSQNQPWGNQQPPPAQQWGNGPYPGNQPPWGNPPSSASQPPWLPPPNSTQAQWGPAPGVGAPPWPGQWAPSGGQSWAAGPPPAPALARPAGSGKAPWGFREILAILGVAVVLTVVLTLLGIVILEGAGRDTTDIEDPLVFLILGATMYVGVGVGIWSVLIAWRKRTWADLGFRPTPLSSILWMIPLAVVMLVVVGIVATLQDQLFGWVPDENSGLPLEEGNLTAGSVLVALIVVVGLAPLFEELFFRGVLFQYLRSRYLVVARGLFEATVISGLAFAALHLGASILPILPVGIVLALVMNRWNSIWPAIALHVFYNAIVLVVTLVSLS